MAAYSALISLMHIIEDVETHPSPPISLDKQQVESLTEIVTFLQEFLDGYESPYAYSDKADPLEIRIIDLTHAAEDVIESYIIDTIQQSAAAATDEGGDEHISCIHFYQDLQNVIEEMDMIKKEVAGIITRENEQKDRVAFDDASLRNNEKEDKQRKFASDDAGVRSSPTEKKNHLMVGFDDMLLELLDTLTDGNTNRQIIPIVGMGGIGKTTLAKGAFEHPLIKYHFDICVWATISQDYNIVEILREVLSQVGGYSSSMDEKDLVVESHKYLWNRRYLIIMDDMWSIDAWDELIFSFPDCGNCSRIIVTTRMSNLASHLTDSNRFFKMEFLDAVSSWTLFSKIVFGEQSFPTQLESIGKKIVEKCNGLPLSIVVIGGLMGKSEHTLENWQHVSKNISSIVNSENDDYCLKILKLSYNHLPAYLKPCFLYMGVFKEDCAISTSTIVKLWVCEGFLKPIGNKSLKTIANEYLKELVDRNLILVHKLGILGNIKSCKIHDLLRDLSLKEAQKHRFFYVFKEHSPNGEMGCLYSLENHCQHRIVIPRSTSESGIHNANFIMKESMSRARSYVCYYSGVLELPNSRFLRTLYTYDSTNGEMGCVYSLENVFHLVNSRYLAFSVYDVCMIPSINLLWNLHTLIIACVKDFIAPIEIWKMHKLRHVEFTYRKLHLPDPPIAEEDIIIMDNLEALKGLKNFNLSEHAVNRIPNIKKLYMEYDGKQIERVNRLNNLQCLSKLQSLWLKIYSIDIENFVEKMSFPCSLKKLILFVPYDFELEDTLLTIGSLPLLEKLSLYYGCFRTSKWETIEGQFSNLRSLTLSTCRDLENWTMLERSHFPLLQELCLFGLEELKEIPSEIGEIPTLRSIELQHCNKSVVLSAKQILEVQEDLQGDQLDLHVHVLVSKKDEMLEKLASSNFEVI